MQSHWSSPASFWRQVRWCDSHLTTYHRRLLMQAWLPSVLGEHLPWHPVAGLVIGEAHSLSQAPWFLLQPVAGQREAFRPTVIGTMVVWLHLLGAIPTALRPGLRLLASPANPQPTRLRPPPHRSRQQTCWQKGAR